MCGHDYITEEIASVPVPDFDWNSKAMGFGGVKKAVDEMFPNSKLYLYKDSSWAVKV